ncbi:MAG: metallophosphoesterase family protein [Archaeoglobus sp.]|uniref:metallophosphoesterase n=1 Tax=Archaeoglobus sp. TaxID=1872626 RepID=UPI001DC2591B|nr:metallophosphoesterase [Archaeoglobus sp.]MBO8179982.1 metallophosphoesterase family protein [Archaeoglobus sp.]
MKDVLFTPERAAIVGNTAVIADLHLGFENVLQEKGYAVPRMQLKEIKDRVKSIIEKYDIDRIVVAGDLKHEFSRNLPYEWEDVREFIESVDVELEVVRGNHDNYLAAILADYGIELKEKVKVGDYVVIHGHKEFEGEKIIMGHEHPAVKIRVRGALYTFPCYLVADSSKIVLPAFSPLMGGSDVLQGNFLSPILQKARKIEVYAVEEEVVYLGSIEDLKKVV